jgi:hypothetical protein
MPQEHASKRIVKQTSRTEIVTTSGPSRPVATALKIDIAKADETDFEKLGIEIGAPLQDPEAIATPDSIGHPVFQHYVEMQGLPVLRVVDPSKVRFSLQQFDLFRDGY